MDKGNEILEDLDCENVEQSVIEAVKDNLNVMEKEVCEGDVPIVPKEGMKFKDENELFDFYKQYAYQVGFPVRKRNSKRGGDGIVRNVTFTCSREGKKNSSVMGSLKPQATIKFGCKARLTASSDINGTWRINKVYLQHNHRTSPSKSRLYRCNRELSAHVKRRLEINDVAGIPLHKSYNSAVVEVGGYENITSTEKDCRNYIEKVRRLSLGDGDALAIQSYFSKMQAHCSGFYFSMDLDEESRLRNVFWADNRCRQACKEFGDVVTFDTTYLTNKYAMPFAPFVGVNHHGQSTLLGCGLVSNEDTKTFVWLSRTWLECMHGQAPLGIITDQDRAMQNAIQIVFPNTKHRWCLWHILKKLPEKLGYHVDKGLLFSAIHELVYDSQTVDDFEAGWRVMIETYELHENEWLSGLYENRARWVPIFLKTTFWAGMSTTQRSESMNAFFDGYVHSKTSLKQFVEQYERALRSKVEKEFHADFKSYSQMVPCATVYEMEKQFQAVYTISKFREFQIEITGKVYCQVISVHDGCSGTMYEVREDVMMNDRMRKKMFSLSFQKDNCDISCNCHLFEFRGILCRHAVTVLIHNDINTIPERYILRRWRRDVTRAHTRVAVHYDGLSSSPAQLRYDKMCQFFANVADLAADDEDRTKSIMEWIECRSKELRIEKSSSVSHVLCHHMNKTESDGGAVGNIYEGLLLDPNCSKTKGAPKKIRKKGALESTSKRTKTMSKSKKMTGPPNTTLPLGAPVYPANAIPQYYMPSTFSYSQLLQGEEDYYAFLQQEFHGS